MIIENQQDVTTAVLAELQRAPDARFKEIMSAFVRHLHDFVREVKLTEEEFHAALAYVVALGKHSNETHNEAVLMSGSLGLSALVCLLNNGDRGNDRNRSEHARAVLAHAFAGHAERRLDRALADAGAGAVRRCLVPRQRRQADRRRGGRHLALLAGRLLREPGSGAGRHEPARQVLHRRGRPHQLPQREAGGLSDPDRRADRRSPARAGAPQHAAGASAFPRQQGRLQDADLAALRRRTTSSSTPTCSSASRAISSATTCATRTRRRRRPTSRARGIRSSTTSSWKPAAPSCRGRRSPARRSGERPKIPHLA